MKNSLISGSLCAVAPDKISEALEQMIEKMAECDRHNEQTICVYNILRGVQQMIRRYETSCSEVIWMATFEEDDDKLRERIIDLCQNALHHDITMAQLYIEKS